MDVDRTHSAPTGERELIVVGIGASAGGLEAVHRSSLPVSSCSIAELQASNEELMSSNEELQSTNEELQSVNEELYTVNAEYQSKIGQLTELTNDMDNLLASTDIGTIFLDEHLRIRKFTPQVADSFNLMPQDLGRSIETFTNSMNYPELVADVRTVLASGKRSGRCGTIGLARSSSGSCRIAPRAARPGR